MKIAFYTIASILVLISFAGLSLEAQTRRMTKAKPQPLPRKSDYKTTLPTKVKNILDANFPNWDFKSDLFEYQNGNSPFRVCQLNEDTIPDYALHILSRFKSDTVEHFLALVSMEGSYKLFTLEDFTQTNPWFGGYYLEIFKRGTEFDNPPFEAEGDNRKAFSTDCISVSMLDKNACNVYLFQHGEFKVFSPCD